jgi:LmbE family N-acetylglucosaminyl deacetylase
MITPLIDCDTWALMMSEFLEWCLPRVPTLIVSPHPDDETLGAGGLIATLCRSAESVRVAAVTDGEHAYEAEPDLASVREAEQSSALRILGVRQDQISRLRIPDRAVAHHEDALFHQLSGLVTADCHILAPWTGDYHPDHEACGRVAQKLAREIGAQLTFYFFWTWHRGTPDDLRGRNVRILHLDDAALRAKSEALQCHRSQLKHPSGEPILPDYLLGPAKWPFEVFLPA